MRCEDAQAEWSAAQDGHGATSHEAQAHMADCKACGAYKADDAWLRGVLASDPDAPPRPGFDTRFFARLHEHKRKRERAGSPGLRRWLRAPMLATAALGAATVAVVLALLSPAPDGSESPRDQSAVASEGDGAGIRPLGEGIDDLELALDLALVQELKLVRDLDTAEAYAALSEDERDLLAMEGDELDALLDEAQTP